MNKPTALFGITLLLICWSNGCNAQTEQQENAKNVAALISKLNGANDSKGYHIAMDLEKYKSDATPLLIKGLMSVDKTTRKYCARAITNIVGGYEDYSGRRHVTAARLPLLEALAAEKDESVAWYITQAVKSSKPEAAKALPVLILTLSTSDGDLSRMVVETIGKYKKDATEALPALSKIYQATKDEWLRSTILFAMNDIGLDDTTLQVISKTKIGDARTASDVLRILFEYPDRAIEFLNIHPKGLAYFDDGNADQIEDIIANNSAEFQTLREYLIARADLPVTARLRIGTPNQLEIIKKQIETMAADPHRRSFFRACARVLGDAPIRPVVTISKKEKGGFRPVSAHPGVAKSRMNNRLGHGDGITVVMISGTLMLADGTLAINPKFFATNDRMLMGQKTKTETPLFMYDKESGRFAYLTSLFAAYSIGGGQEQAGPYQTGSAKTLIEADNSGPLTVEFFDEMPDVKIILPNK